MRALAVTLTGIALSVGAVLPGGAADQAAPTPESVLNGLEGAWDGQLEYRDYQSGRWVGIPMAVTIDVTPDGATRVQKATFTDPGRLVYSVTVSSIRKETDIQDTAFFRENRPMQTYTETVRLDGDPAGPDQWTVVFERKGSDANRPAMIRDTTTRAGMELMTVRTIDFLDDDKDEWLTRNRTRLTRKTP